MKRARIRQNLPTFINKMNSSILSIKRIWKIIKKIVCTQSIPVEAIFEGKVMQFMSKVMKKPSKVMKKPCNEILMI